MGAEGRGKSRSLKRKHSPWKYVIRATEIRRMKIRLNSMFDGKVKVEAYLEPKRASMMKLFCENN